MIAIVDYGVGNLFSLSSSLKALGIESELTADPTRLQQADQVILPGVGAFGDAMKKLQATGLDQVVKQLAASGKPLLGICLGMQLLFDSSEEFGQQAGLGLIPGRIVSLKEAFEQKGIDLKVPHIGWNPITIKQTSPLLKNIQEQDQFYYVHSFYATDCEPHLVATSEYGVSVPGIVAKDNVYGTQFHPEKSGKVGLALLQAFAEVQA
ncbi:imidazole glycerol phosphate synthase, glutamine amidotransferase subunit [Enterococcus asini ATCC 700915]|uniref:Imidazole glycerol phosphate synthase subunit HisH n=1 Tax=Enterococcus asini ATCC 700915 TaxID=1158606 RepID=R2Q8K1_9ENTE|nr:imidazole glycerol phosphate synthase subunit HisH [Enterococcus asini]EOH83412.1 imidazole glycerol phosphate synthase, glutamine amidotransferase subunit [Enterococcus asini ATCC 700915]EOH91628.1 imidazole glycerol phosphate synthase, glutamine amidotransferase subunit [Enterococcus asini ATCC 700915]EOT57212.1 imidazole glycerol phosphate synthase, glutamine amidotransferase subunit [Enterococcus asini ATCC 700915]OJG09297.1 imidazole glycerol phosphate synthase, glutamine amidotransfera